MAKKKYNVSSNIPAAETKSERFIRVVTPRVNKAVKAIRVIGFCSGSTYEYTPKQVEKISQVLFAAMNGLADSFAKRSPAQEEFSFKD